MSKFKIDKITYSKLSYRTTYVTKDKPSMYPFLTKQGFIQALTDHRLPEVKTQI